MRISRIRKLVASVAMLVASSQCATLATAQVIHRPSGADDPAAVPVHVLVTSGSTPFVRLDQNGGSGNKVQVWDVGGNEEELFVRDVSGGFLVPFRVVKGGVVSVVSDGAQVFVENEGGLATRKVFDIRNKGNTKFNIVNTRTDLPDYIAEQGGVAWSFANNGYELRFSRQGSGTPEFMLDNDGNLEIIGKLTTGMAQSFGSDISMKQDIKAIDQESVLERVLNLPISEWSYKKFPQDRHIGPMAHDFYKAFALGESDKTITSIDTGGVALAAIQGLNAKVVERDATIQELQARLKKQDEKMLQLEMAVAELLRSQAAEIEVGAAN